MSPAQRQFLEFQASLQRDQQAAKANAKYRKDTGGGTSSMAALGAQAAREDKVRQHLAYRRHLERISARGNTTKLDLRGKGRRPHERPKDSEI